MADYCLCNLHEYTIHATIGKTVHITSKVYTVIMNALYKTCARNKATACDI